MFNKLVRFESSDQSSRKKLTYIGVVALALLLVSAMYVSNRSSENNNIEETVSVSSEVPQDPNAILGVEEMRTLANNDAPNGETATEVESVNEQGVQIYKVMFSDGSSKLYDARTGIPYEKPAQEIKAAIEGTIPQDFSPGITTEQARNIAQNQRPGKTITQIVLKAENTVVIYSVRFSDNGSVAINASNGNILRVESVESEATE